MAIETAHGALNDPGPTSPHNSTAGLIIDLESALSLLRDQPGFYNTISYAICAPLLLVWMVAVLRLRATRSNALVALAAVAALTMLPIYHRAYDTKLLLLMIPACAVLSCVSGMRRWIALALTTASIVVTGDIPLTLIASFTKGLYDPGASWPQKLISMLLMRPVPIVLLVTGIFFLWVLMRGSLTSDEMRSA
jgi:hypothetical protein